MFLRLKIKNVCICERAPWSGKKLVFVILVQLFAARERARKLIFFLLCNTQRHPQKNKLSFLSKYNFFVFFLFSCESCLGREREGRHQLIQIDKRKLQWRPESIEASLLSSLAQ